MDYPLRISYIQADIVWEDIETNLQHREQEIGQLAGKTDLVVLPEMFTTGFSMNVERFDEQTTSYTVETIQRWSDTFQVAIAGSFIACEEEKYFNRGFFAVPQLPIQFYDKKHLFRLGQEGALFTPGNRRTIVHYKGWNIALFVCYDLRFPVWMRNRDNEYDLLLVVANWPQSRSFAWSQLLTARAIENSCYVCGVNRIGEDIFQTPHSGDSVLLDMKGHPLSSARSGTKEIITSTISLTDLESYRQKFPFWKDGDKFSLLP